MVNVVNSMKHLHSYRTLFITLNNINVNYCSPIFNIDFERGILFFRPLKVEHHSTSCVYFPLFWIGINWNAIFYFRNKMKDICTLHYISLNKTKSASTWLNEWMIYCCLSTKTCVFRWTVFKNEDFSVLM